MFANLGRNVCSAYLRGELPLPAYTDRYVALTFVLSVLEQCCRCYPVIVIGYCIRLTQSCNWVVRHMNHGHFSFNCHLPRLQSLIWNDIVGVVVNGESFMFIACICHYRMQVSAIVILFSTALLWTPQKPCPLCRDVHSILGVIGLSHWIARVT